MLPQILPLFPDNINTFVDLFGGGFNVGININASKIYYNDINRKVVEMLKYFKIHPLDEMLIEIDRLIYKYGLSKTNKQGYLELRDYYNKENQNPLVLYTLICHAFNNQIRFNNKGEYNMPFGKDRSSFNPTLREKFVIFISNLKNKNCYFFNKSFKDLKINTLNENDLVYCDPPYFNTVATYNENGGWDIKQEESLRILLLNLNDNKIKFALSNNISTNTTLKDWAEINGLNVHYLNHTYGNCNYHKKDKEEKDIEVLITNY